MLLMLDEDTRTSGFSFRGGVAGSGSSSSGGNTEIDAKQLWGGEIRAGQRVRIVLPNYRAPRTFEFTAGVKDLTYKTRKAKR